MSTSSEKIKDKEQIENSLRNILLTKMGSKNTLSSALGYSLSEMFDNIWEHAKSEYGWFLAQYYKNKKYVDICIIDNGISIKGSYVKKKNIRSDTSAIKLALKGVSTKKDDRGMGLHSTRNLIINSSLKGKFILLSGQGGYYADKKKDLLFNLNCYWKGTIIFYRLYKTKNRVDWSQYVDYRIKT